MKDTAKVPGMRSSRKEEWTEDEESKFFAALEVFGKDFVRVAEAVGAKSSIQIRCHYNKQIANLKKILAPSFFQELSSEAGCVILVMWWKILISQNIRPSTVGKPVFGALEDSISLLESSLMEMRNGLRMIPGLSPSNGEIGSVQLNRKRELAPQRSQQLRKSKQTTPKKARKDSVLVHQEGPPLTSESTPYSKSVTQYTSTSAMAQIMGIQQPLPSIAGSSVQKLLIRLFPVNVFFSNSLSQRGLNPFLELSTKWTKAVAGVTSHLLAKWKDVIGDIAKVKLIPIRFPDPSVAGIQTIWTENDHQVSVGDIYRRFGDSNVLELRYMWDYEIGSAMDAYDPRAIFQRFQGASTQNGNTPSQLILSQPSLRVKSQQDVPAKKMGPIDAREERGEQQLAGSPEDVAGGCEGLNAREMEKSGGEESPIFNFLSESNQWMVFEESRDEADVAKRKANSTSLKTDKTFSAPALPENRAEIIPPADVVLPDVSLDNLWPNSLSLDLFKAFCSRSAQQAKDVIPSEIVGAAVGQTETNTIRKSTTEENPASAERTNFSNFLSSSLPFHRPTYNGQTPELSPDQALEHSPPTRQNHNLSPGEGEAQNQSQTAGQVSGQVPDESQRLNRSSLPHQIGSSVFGPTSIQVTVVPTSPGIEKEPGTTFGIPPALTLDPGTHSQAPGSRTNFQNMLAEVARLDSKPATAAEEQQQQQKVNEGVLWQLSVDSRDGFAGFGRGTSSSMFPDFSEKSKSRDCQSQLYGLEDTRDYSFKLFGQSSVDQWKQGRNETLGSYERIESGSHGLAGALVHKDVNLHDWPVMDGDIRSGVADICADENSLDRLVSSFGASKSSL